MRSAIEAFTALAYPYWLGVTRTGFAGWLTDHDRADEVARLLAQSAVTLTALKASPALARATALRRPAPTLAPE
jgi:hypothetical protein